MSIALRETFEQIRDLLAGLPPLDEIGDLDFPGGQMQVLGGKLVGKGGNDILQVGFEDIDVSPILQIEPVLFYFLDVGQNEFPNIRQHLLFEFLAVLLPLFQEDSQSGVQLLKIWDFVRSSSSRFFNPLSASFQSVISMNEATLFFVPGIMSTVRKILRTRPWPSTSPCS